MVSIVVVGGGVAMTAPAGGPLFLGAAASSAEVEDAASQRREELESLQAIFGETAVSEVVDGDLLRLRIAVPVVLHPSIKEGAPSATWCV